MSAISRRRNQIVSRQYKTSSSFWPPCCKFLLEIKNVHFSWKHTDKLEIYRSIKSLKYISKWYRNYPFIVDCYFIGWDVDALSFNSLSCCEIVNQVICYVMIWPFSSWQWITNWLFSIFSNVSILFIDICMSYFSFNLYSLAISYLSSAELDTSALMSKPFWL